MRKSRILFFLLAFSGLVCSAQNLYDYKHSIEFANHLYEAGDYNFAVDEYKRAWFLEDISKASQIRLFQAYLYSNQSKAGIKFYQSKYPSIYSSNDSLELIYGKLLISSEKYRDLYWLTDHSKSLDKEQLLYLNLSADLLSGDWSTVTTKREELSDSQLLSPYISILDDIDKFKYKSPALSLGLSVLIPGLGKAYSGYWNEGLISFLSVSLFAWQAYRGFSSNGTSSFYGWTYATLSATFYIGNLYGSFKSANRRNQISEDRILHNVRDTHSNMFRY